MTREALLQPTVLNWLIIATMVACFSAFRYSLLLFSVLAWPGTLAHGAAHWLVALVLNGKPVGFSVFPKRQGGMWQLGHVSVQNLRWYNQAPIALAPLVLIPAAYYAYPYIGLMPRWSWMHWSALYLMSSILFAAIPSWPDWKVAFKSPLFLLALAMAAAVGFLV